VTTPSTVAPLPPTIVAWLSVTAVGGGDGRTLIRDDSTVLPFQLAVTVTVV
jgi:hypothetical protein